MDKKFKLLKLPVSENSINNSIDRIYGPIVESDESEYVVSIITIAIDFLRTYPPGEWPEVDLAEMYLMQSRYLIEKFFEENDIEDVTE